MMGVPVQLSTLRLGEGPALSKQKLAAAARTPAVAEPRVVTVEKIVTKEKVKIVERWQCLHCEHTCGSKKGMEQHNKTHKSAETPAPVTPAATAPLVEQADFMERGAKLAIQAQQRPMELLELTLRGREQGQFALLLFRRFIISRYFLYCCGG